MPSFSMTPARITEPAVGASVWASGSQVCSGNSGTLTEKARAKARKIQRPVLTARAWVLASVTRSKVRASPVARAVRMTRARMPTSIMAEPSIV